MYRTWLILANIAVRARLVKPCPKGAKKELKKKLKRQLFTMLWEVLTYYALDASQSLALWLLDDDELDEF